MSKTFPLQTAHLFGKFIYKKLKVAFLKNSFFFKDERMQVNGFHAKLKMKTVLESLKYS